MASPPARQQQPRGSPVVAVGARGYRGGVAGAPRSPARPRLPPSLAPADPAEHDLGDEATLRRLAVELDLAGRSAESVELDQCRFSDADLSGSSLHRAGVRDCRFTGTNLANLRAEQSSMLRTELTGSRLTGLHWLDGTLREVLVGDCRADLSVFRFTRFHRVRFERCNLTRADFQNADLGGAQFVACDLTGAQFSFARMHGTRFEGCALTDLGGMRSFDGAIIDPADLMQLSYAMAAALGIQLAGPEPATAGDGRCR
ncbi:MAG: pentapeptide repeat-containing protein [Micromonosporaceae bacterium]|nr:pentapeptide repeat-containing protein [Micromonosporaceae bacterium]